MDDVIRKRIEIVRRGEVPEGYRKSGPYVVPKDWTVEKLGNLTECLSRPNRDGRERRVYSVNNIKGFVPQSEQFEDGNYLKLDKSTYKIVKRGEFAYNPARVNVGSIGRLQAEDEVVVSSLYVCVRTNEKLSGEFLDCWSRTQDFQKEVVRNLEGSVREYLFYENFSNIRIPLPSIDEQRKIAEFLYTYERIIELKHKQVAELRRLKASCLARLFPREAYDVPEFRFQGFTEPWKRRSFSEFTWASGKRNKDNLELEPYAITNEQGFVRQSEAHDEFGYMRDTDRSAYNIVTSKSFAYNPARINVGSIGYYEGAEDVIVSSLYEVFQTADFIDDRFLWHWFKSDLFPPWIERLQEGSVRQYFYYDKLRECHMLVPSLVEQQKIANCLDTIDRVITLHRRELDAERKKKKALMQLLLTGLVRVKV